MFIVLGFFQSCSNTPVESDEINIDNNGFVYDGNGEVIIPEEELYTQNPKGSIKVIWDENNKNFKRAINNIDYRGVAIFDIDSCEYVYMNLYGSESTTFLHKENCKYCKERTY